MSNSAIRQALEAKLEQMVPALPTAWENVNFTPDVSLPYQQVTMLFAAPENPSMGDGFYRQRGYMQVSLSWPLGQGAGDAAARADAIRQTFNRGLSLSADGVCVVVDPTPEIGSASVQDDRYVIPVRIRFFANIITES